ncbi:MAG TPA: DUF1800 family protein [Gaiellaceae bacterium]
MPQLAVYRGPFEEAQAERLLWRAGFGPRRGEAAELAKLGLDGAVRALTHPGAEKLVGPEPRDENGRALAPADAWGHDHAWWLDRMVRTSRPLVERMALVWHDWFATSNDGVGSQALMLRQNALFRRRALGSFAQLLLDVTRDPAMLLWLNGTDNDKDDPNENYARELMELFTLGANRGAYSERDVREQARSLTGFRNDWHRGAGPTNFRYDAEHHDRGVKRVFRKKGQFTWQESCRLCLAHPQHPSFFVRKLWGYFVPTAPDAATQRALEGLYGKREVRPVLEAILRHPALHEGQRMTKPPVVHAAGLLRRLGAGVDTDWSWIGELSGQQLFYPPNVSGWDDSRWLDTSTFRGRWLGVQHILEKRQLDPEHPPANMPADPKALLDRALEFWARPPLSDATRAALLDFATKAVGDARQSWKRKSYPVLVENALRQLIAVSPDLQTA